MKQTTRALAAMALVAVAVLTGCGHTQSGPSTVAACTKAYPAWFLASEAAQKTTPTPDACKGLTPGQITAIAEAYLASHG